MVEVNVEHIDNIMILNIAGTISFADIVVISKTYIPKSTCHILFNLTDANMDESVTYQNLCNLPNFVKGYQTHRDPNGKSAHVSPNPDTYGILNMVSKVLEGSAIAHKQRVFKSVKEALEWLSEESS
jgi:hypothetical protein